MNLAVRIILVAVLFSIPLKSAAQGNAEIVEELKRLVGEVADLREANTAQNRRMSQMQKEIDSLRETLRESHEKSVTKMGDFATREDLKKIMDNLRDVDQRRESDKKVILEEFEKLGRTLSQPNDRSTSRKSQKEKEKEPEKELTPIEGTFLPYKVKDGQRLSDIVKEYNGALKEQGRPSITIEQVKRANPKMNPNKILVGQELLLPVPDRKK
jgi:LysM repeat protein